MTPSGALTTLYSFCSQSCAEGEWPQAVLVQDTSGELYGAAYYGGTVNSACSAGCGTLFSLSVGLGPFVKTLTTAGEVAEDVSILGTDLTGATSVTFNGTAAVFEVASPSLIVAKVPTGATSGRVKVVTPSGALSSNARFHVSP
jgi:uncharacterized repeat protein (TIGR03803 family)